MIDPIGSCAHPKLKEQQQTEHFIEQLNSGVALKPRKTKEVNKEEHIVNTIETLEETEIENFLDIMAENLRAETLISAEESNQVLGTIKSVVADY